MASTARLRRFGSLPPGTATPHDDTPISQNVVARSQVGPAGRDGETVEPGAPASAGEDEIDMDFWVSVPPLAEFTIRGHVIAVEIAKPAPPPDEL